MSEITGLSGSQDNIKLKIRVRQLSILHEIARAVTSILDLQSVLNRIVDAAVYLTSAEEGFLMLVDAESQELHLRAGKGLGDKAAKVMRIPVSDSLAGQVLATGKPLRMGGKQQGDSYKVKTGYLVKSLLNVPIKSRDHILGVLSVDHAIESMKTFSDHDVSLLTTLADYAAIAIENARHYEEATKRANALSQALKEAGATPVMPTQEADRQALERFNQGLRTQRDEVTKARNDARTLAQELRVKAEGIENVARRLGLWNEEVDSLLPQLDWIAQTALVQRSSSPVTQSSQNGQVFSVADSLLANLADGVLFCDANGRIKEVNEVAAQILGLTSDELLNKDLQVLFEADARWEHLVGSVRLTIALSEKQAETPPASSATLHLGDRFLKVTLVPINGVENKDAAIIVILRDVSEQMVNRHIRDETVNALSEKLRTPMSTVNSYSDLLLNEAVGLITSSQRRYLQHIRGAVDQMETMLIAFTNQMNQAAVADQTTRTSLITVFNEAIDATKEDLTLAGIELKTALDEGLTFVKTAEDYLTKIIADLLLTAGKHVAVGQTMHLAAKVRPEEDNSDYLVATVQNLSPRPKPEQDLENDQDLSVVAKAVEYQGGRIWIETDYQNRWTISFLLPLKHDSAQEDR